MQVVNPLVESTWNRWIEKYEDASFFHTSEWASVLSESYGFSPKYFVFHKSGDAKAFIPIMEVRSLLTGKRGVSLPFTDYCPPLLEDSIEWNNIWEILLNYGTKSGWKYLELRGGNLKWFQPEDRTIYFEHKLALDADISKMKASIRESTRRNIKKAENSGIQINRDDSVEGLGVFQQMNCITRQEHGLPPQPLRFFRSLYRNVISKGNGSIFIAKAPVGNSKSRIQQGIAAMVFVRFGRKVIYKYGASVKEGKYTNASNLLMWKAIEYFASEGCVELNLGRTDMENSGLRQFKRSWGTSENELYYWKYNFQKGEMVKDPPKVYGIHNVLFSNMPRPFLKLAGTIFYRHMG